MDRLLFYVDDSFRRRIIIRNGTPYFRYDFGLEYNPLAHALVALAYYQRGKLREFLYYTENLAKRASFINFKNGMRVALWYYDFAFPPRAKEPGWISGMAQGVIASAMARAYFITGELKYLQLAREALEGMLLPIEEGGALFIDSKGYVWIEEYPREEPPRHVLNGFVFSIFGLLDGYLATRDRRYYRYFAYCLDTLRNNIQLYDLFVWSKYDIVNIASPLYHLLNTSLVYLLSCLVDDRKFLKTYIRWSKLFKPIVSAYSSSLLFKRIFHISSTLFQLPNKIFLIRASSGA